MNRGYSYDGEVRLGHSFILAILGQVIGHIFQKMGLICPLGTFSSLGRFFPWDVLSLGRLFLRRFVLGRFVLERFVCTTYVYGNMMLFMFCYKQGLYNLGKLLNVLQRLSEAAISESPPSTSIIENRGSSKQDRTFTAMPSVNLPPQHPSQKIGGVASRTELLEPCHQ